MADNSKPKNKNIHSIIALCICIVVSFLMWVYVMTVESPKYSLTISDVTVELTGTDKLAENELAIFSGYGTKIDVTLSGKKSVVSRLTAENIVVTADLSRVDASGRYSLKTVVDVPAGCKLVGVSQDTVAVYVDSSGQITVDLSEKRENNELPEGSFVGAVEYDIDKVTVTGPLSMLSKVSEALVTLDMAGITKTTAVTEKIRLVDAGGTVIDSPYIDYFPKEIKVDIPILRTERVPLEVEFKNGFLSYDNTVVTVEPEFVDVTGDAALVEKGGCVKPIIVDEKTAMGGGSYSSVVALEAEDGIILSTVRAKLNISLKPGYAVKEFTVAENNIKSKKNGGDTDLTWDSTPVTVELLGRADVLAAMTDDDVNLVFDASPYSDYTVGDMRIKAEVETASRYSGEVLPVGTYFVNVSFGRSDG